jgi:chromosome partitioning protein
LDEAGFARTKQFNVASALGNEENRLGDFVTWTKRKGVDLIASTPYLSDLRSVNEKRLSRMIQSLSGMYDAVIIDCHPTYDNIVLNAVNAADYIITPVLKDIFSYNTAKFFSEVLTRDTCKAGDWFVLLNGYNKRYEDSRNGRQKEFIELYSRFPLMPKETWFPWTSSMREIVDYNKLLAREKTERDVGAAAEGIVRNPVLYDAVYALADSLLDDESVSSPEAF